MRIDPEMPILVVDDYVQMLRIINGLLRDIGFENVDTAMDGAEALRKLRRFQYGMVISDWNMEPMTGYQLLEEIRSDEELHDMPFIMVTAESKTEFVISAKQAGVSNYIVKPFTSLTLKEKMEQVFADY
ncbi:MAG: response regulator [Minwuia sp.]|uniref:response regulator n=1 Tax=Minwuia sp. TaxID=2493630 RepID=UPI003A8C24E9